MKIQSDINRLQDLLSDSRKSDADDIDKVLSVLAQVSLAVLIIFIMIAILFATKYREEAEYYKYRAEELAKTSTAKVFIDLQRQKLLLALERTNHYYIINLGHHTFYKTDVENQRVVNMENIITGHQIRYDFLKACEFAQIELINFDAFKEKFARIVIADAGLAPSGINVPSNVLDAQNRDWFEKQVRGYTTALYEDTIQLQENSKEGLAIYYQTHLSEIAELQTAADELAKNPTPDKINIFMRRVNIFVENELQRQNVKFLQTTRSLER